MVESGSTGKGGLTAVEKKSIQSLLDQVEARFLNSYKAVDINGDRCLVGPNGTVFYFVALVDFGTIIVEYANNVSDAKKGLFEDGDQFDINQSFESLIADIEQEISTETAV